jgi:uracil-DNA glycosylase
MGMERVEKLVKEIGNCRHCPLPQDPRPVIRVSATARLCIAGQAPGIRVHKSGLPFDDPSGDRLQEWMGVSKEQFYGPSRISFIPIGFCFPGHDAKGGDLPPRKECALLWRQRLFKSLPQFELIVLVGGYAQKWHLGKAAKPTLTETVQAWASFMPDHLPLPHPSWRNNGWLRKNPWYDEEVLPVLRRRVGELIQ